MCLKVLIVEDEMLVAMNMAAVLEDAGHEAVGIAADSRSAFALAGDADLAVVDVNLLDGPTGPGIGARLAYEWGLPVVFVTANPRQLGAGVPGTLGVMEKPCDDDALLDLVAWAAGRTPPPRGAQAFARINRDA